MKGIFKFLRVTLAGGVLFLLPIIILVVIVQKALVIAKKLVAPLAAHLPMQPISGLETPVVLAIILLVFVCFFAGFFSRTKPAKKAVDWLESRFLSNLPGYEVVKRLSANMLAADNQQPYPVVLARIENAWQLAFLMERLESGHVAVFVPGAPRPLSGAVYFMTEDRVRLVDVPPMSVIKCLRRCGLGSNELLGSRLASFDKAVATPILAQESRKIEP